MAVFFCLSFLSVLCCSSSPSSPLCPVLAVLPWLSYLGSPILPVLFCLSSSAVQFCLSYSDCLLWGSPFRSPFFICPSCLLLADMCWQPFLYSLLSWLSCQPVLLCLSCVACPVLLVQFFMSCPARPFCMFSSFCPVLPVLICLSCSACPFLSVLSFQSCPGCRILVVLSWQLHLVRSVLSWHSCPGSPLWWFFF